MNRKVLLVQFVNQKILAEIKLIWQSEQPQIISLSNTAALQLRGAMVPFKDFTGYLQKNSFSEVNDKAVEMVRLWYKQVGIKELCTFEGVNMGEFSELFLTSYFMEVFKRLVVLEKICAIEHPTIILYSSSIESFTMGLPEDLWAKTVEIFANKNNLETVAFHSRSYSKFFLVKEGLKYWSQRYRLYTFLKGGMSLATGRVYLKLLFNRPQDRERSQKKKIVFVGPAHLLTASVELVEILGQNDYEVEVITREDVEAGQLFWERGIEVRTFIDIKTDKAHRREIKDRVKQFKNNLKHQGLQTETPPPLLFKGVNLWDIIADRLHYEITYIYPRLIEEMEIFRYKLEKENIRVVVVPTSVAPEARAMLKQAVKAGVLTIEIQHGITKWAPSFLPLIADRVFVWGQMTKDWYKKQGIEDERVVITGRLSKRARRKKSNIELLKKKLSLAEDKKIVLVGTQPAIAIDSLTRLKGNGSMIQAVIDELSELENVILMVKLHPGENLADYSNINLKPGKVLIIKQGNIEDYLEVCDVLMVGDSSIGIDAMMSGKPVIYLNLEGEEDLVPYPKYGAFPVYKKEEIRPTVKKALAAKRGNYKMDDLKSMIMCEGRQAAQNAFQAITMLIKK